MSSDADDQSGQAGFLERTVGSIVNPIVDVVDIDHVLEDVDINGVVQRVDIDALLERVDIDALLERIDLDRLLERIDIQALLDRVDVNAIVEDVDVNEIVERTELGSIIARSTTGVFTQLLDVVRTQIVTVDQVVQGLGGVLLRRRGRSLPPAPPVDDRPQPDGPDGSADRAIAVQGRVAGSVSRFLAFLADTVIIAALFALGTLLAQAAIQVVINEDLTIDETRTWVVVAYALWWFTYMSASLAATGRTIGKALLGLLVVDADGTRLQGRRAMLRSLAFPLSFLVFGVGFLIGLFRRDRRELHDLIAGTAVIYAWDATTARMRADALADVESPSTAPTSGAPGATVDPTAA